MQVKDTKSVKLPRGDFKETMLFSLTSSPITLSFRYFFNNFFNRDDNCSNDFIFGRATFSLNVTLS